MRVAWLGLLAGSLVGCGTGADSRPPAADSEADVASETSEETTPSDAGEDVATDAQVEAADAVDSSSEDAVVDSSSEDSVVADTGPKPSTIAIVPSARGIAVASGYAYVTALYSHGIWKVAVDGSSSVKFASAEWPTHVAVDATHVYWTDLGLSSDGNVSRMLLTGGPVETLASKLSKPNSTALGSGFVLWVSYPSYPDAAVQRVPRTGGETTTIGSGESPSSIVAANNTTTCWTTGKDSGAIRCQSLTLGTPTTLATGEGGVRALAMDETDVFWIANGKLRTSAIALAAPKTLAESPAAANGNDVAIDATHAYWVTLDGRVRRVPRAGGTVETLAASESSPVHLALDATHVYWTSIDGVRKMPK